MEVDAQKTELSSSARSGGTDEVTHTFEWLIIAFVLAFIFRAFIMQAYRIPTGSMADTLMGAHFSLRCSQCGYKYDYGFEPGAYRLPQDVIPDTDLPVVDSRCPSCGYYQPAGGRIPVSKGDRIFVLKCIYQFFEPKQWDVIVFKNPLNPSINYIKRLIGRPGETVEIIDGDIYIDDRISRKPPKVQAELWMPVYDNDYQPVRPNEPSFNNHVWQQPFRNISDSKWTVPADNTTQFHLDSPPDIINSLSYDTAIGNDFRATYAYNDVGEYEYMPYCSDLMVRFYVKSTGQKGRIGASLSKYQNTYSGWVDLAGEMVIAENEQTILVRKELAGPVSTETPVELSFANVDHQLLLRFGTEKLVYDLGLGPDDAGSRMTDIEPQVRIFGSGELVLSHLAVFRDIHYTASKFAGSPQAGRAIEGNPFTLAEDEFFVLGDNSPVSGDARWWPVNGKGNNGLSYRAGVVPREYLTGKAFVVFWPAGFKPSGRFPFSFIPDTDRMHFICGGSGKKI